MTSPRSLFGVLTREARQGRLARRLIFWTVIFSGIIALLITVVQLVIEYRRDVQVVDERFALVENSYLPSVVDSVWVTDRERLSRLLTGIVRMPDFAYAEAHHNGETLVRVGGTLKGDGLIRRWPLRYTYRGKELLIGELEVGADLAAARERFVERAWFIVGANFLKTLLVAGFLFLLVHYLVTRHLERISRYAGDLSPQRLDLPLRLDRKSGGDDDEIGRLVDALNLTREKLRLAYADLRDANQSLEARVAERTAELTREMTKRQEHENALVRSEGQLRSIFDAALEGIIVTDESGHIVVFNAAAGRMFGYAPEELVGDSINRLMPADHARAHNGHIDRYLQTGTGGIIGTTREVRGLRRDGTPFPLLIGLSECCADSGNRLFVAMVQDLTERRRFEEALMTAKLAAEQASAAKSEFLSSMSHELRTPLNAILGFSQLLSTDRDEPLTPSQQSSVDQILNGGRHLLELINEVLDLARIEAGKLDLQMAPVDVGPMVAGCLRGVEPLARKDGITLHGPARSDPGPQVMADATRLRQALINLLSNAIKYNRSGGEVFVETHRDGEWLCLAVRDTGVGFTEAQAKLLFQPFSRLESKVYVEGAGIGLALTRRMVELMGGRIEARGEPGVGATFSIFLKVAGG